MFQKWIMAGLLLGTFNWTVLPVHAPSVKNAAGEPQEGVLFRSTDMGLNWEPVAPNLPRNMEVTCLGAHQGQLLLGTYNYGLYQGSRNFTGWQPADMTLLMNQHVTALSVAGAEIFASTLSGGLYKSTNGGQAWTSLSTGLSDQRVWTFAQQGNALLLGTDKGILRSSDSGKTWRQVCDSAQVFSLSERNGILIGGNSSSILRSRDGGLRWESVRAVQDGVWKSTVIDDNFVVMPMTGTLLVSKDGGKTWQNRDHGLPPEQAVLALAKAGKYWICSTEDGLYRSDDQGAHWRVVRAAGEVKFTELIVVDGVIYGGTAKYGGPAKGGGC